MNGVVCFGFVATGSVVVADVLVRDPLTVSLHIVLGVFFKVVNHFAFRHADDIFAVFVNYCAVHHEGFLMIHTSFILEGI